MGTFCGKGHFPGVDILCVAAVAISGVLSWDYLMQKAYGEPHRSEAPRPKGRGILAYFRKDAECL